MARIDVVMPQMGESIAEGTMSRWLKKVGDSVKRDEPLFEISTDKVDAEIPAPSAGILVEVIVTEGQTVPVQTVVARLETDASVAAAAPATTSAPSASAVVVGVGPPPVEKSSAPTSGTQHQSSATPTSSVRPSADAGSFEERIRTKSSPLVRKIAAEHGIELVGMLG